MADAQRTALQYDLSKVSVFKAISRSYLQRCYGTNFKQVLSEMDKNTYVTHTATCIYTHTCTRAYRSLLYCQGRACACVCVSMCV